MIRIKTLPLAIVAVAAIFSGVMIAKSIGYYETTASKEPVKFKTGELAGLPNPADIRGSYTWVDIEKAFGVPAKEAAAAFSVSGHALDPTTRVSELETIYAGVLPAELEIGTGAVRLFVSLYTGLPFEAEAGSVLPEGALALLAARPGMNLETLNRFAIPGSAGTSATTAAVPFTAPAMGTGTAATSGSGGGNGSGSGSGRAVVGKTTFGDLYSWGLDQAQVEAAIGFKPGLKSQTIREASAAAGIEFSTFKTALQTLVDKTAP